MFRKILISLLYVVPAYWCDDCWPHLVIPANYVTLSVGQTSRITCDLTCWRKDALNFTDPPTLQWIDAKNQTIAADNAATRVFSTVRHGGHRVQLHITDVQYGDSGIYSCQLRHADGDVISTQTAHVTVVDGASLLSTEKSKTYIRVRRAVDPSKENVTITNYTSTDDSPTAPALIDSTTTPKIVTVSDTLNVTSIHTTNTTQSSADDTSTTSAMTSLSVPKASAETDSTTLTSMSTSGETTSVSTTLSVSNVVTVTTSSVVPSITTSESTVTTQIQSSTSSSTRKPDAITTGSVAATTTFSTLAKSSSPPPGSSQSTVAPKSDQSAFGKYGLLLFGVTLGVCLTILLIIFLVLCIPRYCCTNKSGSFRVNHEEDPIHRKASSFEGLRMSMIAADNRHAFHDDSAFVTVDLDDGEDGRRNTRPPSPEIDYNDADDKRNTNVVVPSVSSFLIGRRGSKDSSIRSAKRRQSRDGQVDDLPPPPPTPPAGDSAVILLASTNTVAQNAAHVGDTDQPQPREMLHSSEV